MSLGSTTLNPNTGVAIPFLFFSCNLEGHSTPESALRSGGATSHSASSRVAVHRSELRGNFPRLLRSARRSCSTSRAKAHQFVPPRISVSGVKGDLAARHERFYARFHVTDDSIANSVSAHVTRGLLQSNINAEIHVGQLEILLSQVVPAAYIMFSYMVCSTCPL